MSKRAWVAAVVFGGLIPFSEAGLAQNADGVTIERPSVEKDTASDPNDGEPQTGEFSVPVRIVETPEQANRARDREEKSDQHEADDLEAQQRAAEAAERSAEADERGATSAEWQVIPAWTQIFVALVGTIALICTLLLTRKSVQVAEKQLMLVERPWVSVDAELVGDARIADECFVAKIRFVFRNKGGSVATNVFIEAEMIKKSRDALDRIKMIQEKALRDAEEFRAETDHKHLGKSVFPEQDVFHEVTFTTDRIREADGVAWPTLVGTVSYFSPLDEKTHRSGFVFYFYVRDDGDDDIWHAIHLDGGPVPSGKVVMRAGFVNGIVD